MLEELQDFNLVPIEEGGDLAPVGELCTLLERAATECADTKQAETHLAAAAVCDWLILAEGDAATSGREAVCRFVRAVLSGGGSCNDEERDQLIHFIADHLPPEAVPGLGSAGARASAADTPPSAQAAADQLVINSDEDLIIYNEFISESIEHLESIELRVLDLEQQPSNTDIINAIFRAIHSIKGAAGFLGLSTTNALCHELETMLDRARKLTLTITQEIIDTILAGVDLEKHLLSNLTSMVSAHQAGGKPPALPVVDIGPVIAAIQFHLKAPPPPQVGATEIEPDRSKLGGQLVAEGSISEDDLKKALSEQKRPLGKILVDMGATSQEQVEAAAAVQAQAPKQAAAIKVSTDKLDLLMDTVGELVIAQSLVHQGSALEQRTDLKMRKSIENLSKITRNLQTMVMSIRMVPLRQTFHKMQRLVRDTSRKTGKEVQLNLSGEETEIDKTVIDEIADPLVHLLRNAVDHGIATPEERVAAGKAPEGRVGLSAYHQGGNVVIEVSDDGQGLDRDRILEKAAERGLANPKRQDYSEAEIFAFIMAPGFSTAKVTTDISGRGVGMDVVKRNIEHLGGRLDIRSTLGEGTTFAIRLPLTMAIADGMLVRVGKERFIVPTLSIEESLRPTKDMISTVKDQGMVVMVRSQLIPLVHLCELFEHQDSRPPLTESLVIIVSFNEQRIGLVVDALMGQQQVVIKSLGDKLRGIKGVSGGCILGDGQVALILDIDGLVTLARGEG
ncbi:MAG: chemotaxis protein CheA [Planctomycetota bacterium]|jgi:two-component system chemotaxis sensor kinase CheA